MLQFRAGHGAAQPYPHELKFKSGASANVDTALRNAGGRFHRRLDNQRAISVTTDCSADATASF